MKQLFAVFFCIWLCLAGHIEAAGRDRRTAEKYTPQKDELKNEFTKSAELRILLETAVAETLENFRPDGIKSDEIAATLIDLRDPENLPTAGYRGDAQIYPASVVKLFYLDAFYQWLEAGKIKLTPELERGLENMIVESGNESTGYILDVLTETTSGPEMPVAEFRQWAFKRNAVNRYFASRGYENINVNQKTHCEDAWGREQQFRNYKGENRNMLTTDATARLFAEIVRAGFRTPENKRRMLELLSRDWENPAAGAVHTEFISHALKPGMKLWSKEGWTSRTRHDAAYIETPAGLRFVLVIFTEKHAHQQEIIPSVARRVIEGLGEIKQ